MIAFRNPVSNDVRLHSYYLQMQYKIAVYTNVCSNCYTVKVQHHRACGRLLLFAKTVTANSSSLNWQEQPWRLRSTDFIVQSNVQFIVYIAPTTAVKEQSAVLKYTRNTAVIVGALEIKLMVYNQHTSNCKPQVPGSLLSLSCGSHIW
jgi:hypothetical protein